MVQASGLGSFTANHASCAPAPALSLFLAIALFALAPSSSRAQQSSAPSSQSPTYTLRGSSRIVLTDVTVKDRAGRIVHGLPESAFHIFDNKQPQTISSFEEHNAAPTAIEATPASAPNTYSNEFLKHLPPVLNIVVLDTTDLNVPQQMYLSYEFNRFLKTLPPDLPLAIYARTGEKAVLVQDFTSNHDLLLAASKKVMPHLPPPGRDPLFINDLALLEQVSAELAQLPGRKNVLWFSGGERISDFDPTTVLNPGPLRPVYDLLEKARVAIYPIDARGLMVLKPSAISAIAMQQMQMEQTAEDTGGEAFFNRNDIDHLSDEVLHTDNSFYTIVFSPKDFVANGKWHNIKVEVDDGNYHLSYRRGYFADGMNLGPDENNGRQRTILLANGATKQLPANLRSSPIIFTASLLPPDSPSPNPGVQFYPLNIENAPKKGTKPYLIRYSLPPDVFSTQLLDGRENASFDVAVLAFNQAGERVGMTAQHVALKFPSNNPHMPINIAQNIDLRRGDLFLYIAVWDTTNGRSGTLQIPFTVK